MGRKQKTPPTRKKSNQRQTKLDRLSADADLSFSIIGLSDRLDKPFINFNNYVEEEDGVEYNFRPRRIFVNGLCLVCTKICKNEVLCEGCQMVSYCSEKHRKENCDEHKLLCSVVKQFYGPKTGFHLDPKTTPDEYRIFRVELLKLAEQSLQRCLDLWEREIILYPRLCRTCYAVCSESCEACGVDFLCPNEEHARDHLRWCSTFKIFGRMTQLQREHGNAKPRIPDTISDSAYELPNDFDEVVAHLIRGTKLYDDMDGYNYAVLSHLSSVPLTTLYAFQKTCDKDWQQKKSLTIHIVGAEFEYECADLRFWEKMFLHFLPALKELKLVIIGPELQAPKFLLDALATLQLCANCQAKRKTVKIEFHPAKLYHEVKSLPVPDMVCLFNPGLYRQTGYSTQDTWPETIKEFCKHKVPVVVTSYTEYEMPRDIARIKSTCSIEVLLKSQRNSFASLKPDRNFVSDHTDPLIFKNYYVTVVRGN